MGFIDDVKQAAADLANKAKQFKNNTFKEAVIAICARVAAADGDVSSEEKRKVAQAIQRNEALTVFNATELRDLFNKYCDDAIDDFGIVDLNNKVAKLKKNREAAITAAQIGVIIARADGNFDNDELKVMQEVLGLLGLSEAEVPLRQK